MLNYFTREWARNLCELKPEKNMNFLLFDHWSLDPVINIDYSVAGWGNNICIATDPMNCSLFTKEWMQSATNICVSKMNCHVRYLKYCKVCGQYTGGYFCVTFGLLPRLWEVESRAFFCSLWFSLSYRINVGKVLIHQTRRLTASIIKGKHIQQHPTKNHVNPMTYRLPQKSKTIVTKEWCGKAHQIHLVSSHSKGNGGEGKRTHLF
jgi:hypothetical protein